MVIKLKRNLKIGMQGNDVKALHEALIAVGFSVNGTPRHFGQETKNAVEEIQKRLGMKVSGLVNQPFFDRLTNPFILKGQVPNSTETPLLGPGSEFSTSR